MSREKQIEEMAWDLCDIPKHPNIKSCEQCGNKHCHAMYYAERAYNAGYHKQSEGEWKRVEVDLGGGVKTYRFACTNCGFQKNTLKGNFCPTAERK
ncbi:MAG: hypothetical protein J6S14_04970 [Clostridia bacterium]|nr:hypothetical protein [Clostridia bacterium]